MRADRNNYEIVVTETKSRSWVKKAYDSTVRFNTNVPDLKTYLMEHSPIRQIEWCIEMRNIPVFVMGHFVRSGPGTQDYVLTNRDDRGGRDDSGRWTATNHTLFINAEALITLASKRLCLKSHKETVYIMNLIKKEIAKKDPDLTKVMVPMCVRRNGLCPELRNTCGFKDEIMKKYSYYKELFKF